MSKVLVVGAGPVGLTLAAELARYGIGVRLIDRSLRATETSKALVVWSRTLELTPSALGMAPTKSGWSPSKPRRLPAAW